MRKAIVLGSPVNERGRCSPEDCDERMHEWSREMRQTNVTTKENGVGSDSMKTKLFSQMVCRNSSLANQIRRYSFFAKRSHFAGGLCWVVRDRSKITARLKVAGRNLGGGRDWTTTIRKRAGIGGGLLIKVGWASEPRIKVRSPDFSLRSRIQSPDSSGRRTPATLHASW
jgi:hypothetical protein